MAVIEVDIRENGIRLVWSDSEDTMLNHRFLRLSCGCAHCVEELTNKKLLDPDSVPQDIKAEDFLFVGRYAVQFLWSDGHYTGIYPFDILRELSNTNQN